MSEHKWVVRIHNNKGEHWDTFPARSETDARMQAEQITTVNKSWRAFVKHGGERVDEYRKGRPVKKRSQPKEPAPKAEATLTRRCTKCGTPFDGPASATMYHCSECAKGCEQCTPATPKRQAPLEVVRKALEFLTVQHPRHHTGALAALSEVEAALRPFAAFSEIVAEAAELGEDDPFHVIVRGAPLEVEVTLADCRRARAVLRGEG